MSEMVQSYRTAKIETQMFEIDVMLNIRDDGSIEEKVYLRVIGGAITRCNLTDASRVKVTTEEFVEVISSEM